MPPAEDGPPERLPIQPWMADPATRAVIAALEAKGGPGAARFVGGCVRNALLGRAIDDIDIATILTPDQVMAALKAAKVKSVPTGVEHGTVTAIAQGRPFEVTTLRRDVETDGRRAVVAFTTDWGEDAQRRDFRLNALYMDGQGRLYDPTQAGVEDALAGRIVFVGDPETRIREDYLRILRFFRFRAWFGRGPPDVEGLQACAALKDGLSRLSAERVSKELLKLLAAPDPVPAVMEMAGAGVMAEILPEAELSPRFRFLAGVDADPELRLAALLPQDPAIAVEAARRLRLSNAQRERLRLALTPDPEIQAAMTLTTARRRLYALGRPAFKDRVELAWAAQQGEGEPWRRLIEAAQSWTSPKFPLSGHDAAAIGIQAGPELGEALRRAEAYWVERDFQPDREALVAWLKR